MAPQFVKPYVKTNKNDVADAEAICEAVARPNMRFVPVKSVEQQAVLALHRVRQGFVKARTAQANQIRSLLGEFGLVMPKGITNVRKRVPELVEHARGELPAAFRHLVDRMLDHLKELDRQVGELEAQIKAWHRSSELSQKLEKIPGIGPWAPARWWRPSLTQAASTTGGRCRRGLEWCHDSIPAAASRPYWASASVVMFICARCSFMARVPRLLQRSASVNPWLAGLLQRRNPNVAAVALANKNARTVWALLAHDREFQPDYVPTRPAA
jgi:transposase